MTSYQPELGQMAHGAPWGDHALPEAAKALFMDLKHRLDTVWWNEHQTGRELWEDAVAEAVGAILRPRPMGDFDARPYDREYETAVTKQVARACRSVSGEPEPRSGYPAGGREGAWWPLPPAADHPWRRIAKDYDYRTRSPKRSPSLP